MGLDLTHWAFKYPDEYLNWPQQIEFFILFLTFFAIIFCFYFANHKELSSKLTSEHSPQNQFSAKEYIYFFHSLKIHSEKTAKLHHFLIWEKKTQIW